MSRADDYQRFLASGEWKSTYPHGNKIADEAAEAAAFEDWKKRNRSASIGNMTTIKFAVSNPDESLELTNRLIDQGWDTLSTTNPVRGDEFPHKVEASGELPPGTSSEDFAASITKGLKYDVE